MVYLERETRKNANSKLWPGGRYVFFLREEPDGDVDHVILRLKEGVTINDFSIFFRERIGHWTTVNDEDGTVASQFRFTEKDVMKLIAKYIDDDYLSISTLYNINDEREKDFERRRQKGNANNSLLNSLSEAIQDRLK